MRILICHNTYQLSGGEDTVVNAEFELLKKHGHDVLLYLVSNDEIKGLLKKISTGIHVSYSKASKENLSHVLVEFQPDIVHFHNTFPLLTASVYDACKELNIPVIQTLHNFRPICPSALLLRDNKVCELCINRSPYNAVKYRCYRDSILESFAVSNMVAHHRKHFTWDKKVDRFIALTRFSQSKFIQAGFPPERITTKPNFIATPQIPEIHKREGFALYVGRLSKEKGTDILCKAFSGKNISLKIAGDGPLLQDLKQYSTDNIEFLGLQSRNEIYTLMSKANVLVMPSICYEGFPMVLVEAYAHGLPVICSRLGSMKEIVKDKFHGLHFSTSDHNDLSCKIEDYFSNPDQEKLMSANVRKTFLKNYTDDQNYQHLMCIYQEVINEY